MKFLLVLSLAVVCFVYAADEKKGIKIYQRHIPADVLRDFPGACFASTKCETFEPGKSWELAPFCGRSTCVAEEGKLVEVVEDCGPLPKENPKCKISDKTNKTAAFPDCCPIFDCEPGVTLEYPTIPELPKETPKKS